MMGTAPPRAPPGSGIIEILLRGHLTRDALRSALLAAAVSIDEAGSSARVLVDCRDMSGYDTDARELFVSWNSEMRSRIARLAVVTERGMWHLVVSGMALASGQPMKAFKDRVSAMVWLK